MSEYLEKIVYLSQADYNTLLNGGSITRNGITLDSLEDNYLYITDGTISSTDISGVIPISKGGTNASTASDARLNLGLGDAATKSVVTSISTSTNLPTSTAVKTYVDNSVATRIPTTGTAGDILYWSATDTPAHLAKGNNGKVLKLANGLPTWGDAGTVTSVQVQASSPLQSSTSTAQSSTLNTTISFTNQNANVVLAGPSSGSSAAAPTFRSLVAADIPSLDWSKIGSGKPTTLSGYGITDAATSGHTQAVNKGGTNITSYTIGDMLYASASTTLSKLAGNTTTTVKYLKSVATTSGTAVAPVWAQIAASEISGLGTMATETASNYILKSTLSGAYDIMYSSAANTPTRLAANTTATRKYLSMLGTGSAGAAPSWEAITYSTVGAAASSHTHGNIQNGGTLQTTDVTIGSGDKLVITDSSDSNKVARASLAFSASVSSQSQTTKFLREDGTWQAPSYTTNTNNAVTHTLATTTKYYVTGTTSATTSTAGDSFDTGVFVTTTAGELSSVRYAYNVSGTGKAYTTYNTTDDCIDFIFV